MSIDFSALWKHIKGLFTHEHQYVEDDFLIVKVCRKCGDTIVDWNQFG